MGVTHITSYSLIASQKEEGYPDGTNIPLIIKEKFASENHIDYILTGNIQKADDNLNITTNLYKTGGKGTRPKKCV